MMNPTASSEAQHIYSVSELNRDVKTLLETGFPLLWIEGEISNFTAPSSGHWYFTLKDSKAQVRCAMFKGRAIGVGFTPRQGDKVVIRARISLYEARGDYQLIAESMEEAGFGALQRQFEALKNKLQTEGLFASTHKKELPKLPAKIGVITSPTGAAIRDILSVLKRRFPSTPVLIYPTMVQGEQAAPQIAKAIAKANQNPQCDVLILTRGGGSLEDLWAFNEEIVAKAVFHSEIPVVSAVGHEIDITISDFVADKRAPTPSAAAEMVVPDQREYLDHLQYQQQKLARLLLQNIKQKQQNLIHLTRRLKHPSAQLREHTQKLDDLEIRLKNNMQRQLIAKQNTLSHQLRLLGTFSPQKQLILARQQTENTRNRLLKAFTQTLNQKKQQLASSARALNVISPLATLDRGYSIVSHRNNNCIIRSWDDVEINEELDIKLANGKLVCTVKENTSD